MRALLALPLALVLAACQATHPRPPLPADAPTFRVATWNMQHWVDALDDPRMEHDQDEEHVKSEAQLDAIEQLLREIDADVIAFQEVEGIGVLRDFAEERLEDMGYVHFAAAPDFQWHQNVAVMSRVPLGPMTSMGLTATEFLGIEGEEPTNFINDRLLAIEVRPDEGYEFLMTVVHLKAGGGDRNAAWRRGQIAFLHGWLEQQAALDPDLNVCVLGDFNAEPDASEMEGWWADAPCPAVARPLLSGGNAPSTHPAWEPRRTIDNILLNGAMRAELLPATVEVYEVGPFDGGYRASDHMPVAASFVARDR